jgi:hypothetical protein
VKAARSRQFLADFDPRSKALEDYVKAADALLSVLHDQSDARDQAQTA